jgi:hypothetical protein
VAGVNQVQVDEKSKKTFGAILRAMLRQDPDVMMIGEIRDNETAQIAFRAAITGHLVLSTVHTNDAASAVTRLVDLGLQPFMVASTSWGHLHATRAVLCPNARTVRSLRGRAPPARPSRGSPPRSCVPPVGRASRRAFADRVFELLDMNDLIRGSSRAARLSRWSVRPRSSRG